MPKQRLSMRNDRQREEKRERRLISEDFGVVDRTRTKFAPSPRGRMLKIRRRLW